LRLHGGGPLLLFGARIDRQHEHGGHDRRSYDAHQVPRTHVHPPNHRASELLAKSSFLAPKRFLDAWLLLMVWPLPRNFRKTNLRISPTARAKGDPDLGERSCRH
jgi:hypothetical protein